MPLYEFRCDGCGIVTERLAKMDTDEIICPVCESKASRIMSVGSFSLTGTGWYHTDFKGK